MNALTLKYRTWYKGIPPQPVKLKIPGWAGDPGYSSGMAPQAWHCKPFVDAATYGLELLYPWDATCEVTTGDDGKVRFEGDFSKEEMECGIKLPPFMNFAPGHYGFTSSLDIETDPGYVVRIEPHARFYTDTTGTVPVPVPGHIESEWWPRIFFVVFKAPRPGERHVFRKGEPYAQILVLPDRATYDAREMTATEILRRAARDTQIVDHGTKIANHSYIDHAGNKFNNKYRVLSKECKKGGIEGVDSFIKRIVEKIKNRTVKKIPKMKVKK
jgi:hypothetical protein